MIKINPFWFRPKKYGYGAYPNTWEGWLLTFVYVILLILIIKNIIMLSIFLKQKENLFLNQKQTIQLGLVDTILIQI